MRARKREEELNEVVNQMVEQARQHKQKLNGEQILENSFVGYKDDIREKIKQAEKIGVKKMVISVRSVLYQKSIRAFPQQNNAVKRHRFCKILIVR